VLLRFFARAILQADHHFVRVLRAAARRKLTIGPEGPCVCVLEKI
jgi:hypothetical protein